MIGLMRISHLVDKVGRTFDLEVVSEFENFVHIWVIWNNIHIGEIKYLLHDNNQLELADIVIFDPVITRTSLWEKLLPWLSRTPKSFRGAGLGSAMLEFIIAHAKELKIADIHGDVTAQDVSNNPHLLDWYQRYGFTISKEPYRLKFAVASIHRNLLTTWRAPARSRSS